MVITKNKSNKTPKNTQTQDAQQQKNSLQIQCMTTSGAGPHCPQTQDYQVPQNFQCTQTQPFDIPHRYVEQICLRREWEKMMEKLNEKYGLDYFSDSDLDSKSYEGENYKYEHKYETLI